MIRDIPSEEFERMSNEEKKRYIVNLLIREAKATPVEPNFPPVAFVMAGLPGAGKTEFLDSLIEGLHGENKYKEFVRIDLDQIVTIYPGYTPKTYAKYRSQGNVVLARCVDVLRKGRFNMMIDGTFSGPSGSSVNNVEKLLNDGYVVIMVYMHDNPKTAWNYTQVREKELDRGISKEGFLEACKNLPLNLADVTARFFSHPSFSFTLVKQRELRGSNYEFVTDINAIDAIIDKGYNIDKIKEIL